MALPNGYNSTHPTMMMGNNFTTPSPGPARIAYFITRSNGLPIPLIPADELPFSIKLQNVPRVLTPEQTYGLQYVGTAPYTGCTFKSERETTSAIPLQRSNSQPPNEAAHARTQSGTVSKQFLAPDALARAHHNSALNGTSNPNLPKRPISAAETAKSWRRSDPPATAGDTTQSVIDAILNSSSGAKTAERLGYRSHNGSPPPSGVIPDQERKEYCTHWILQGWCAFEQQGCRYKHEMLDKEGLTKIGIRNVPRWWQERNAPFKLGDRPAVVGPLMKPEEWLNARKGSDADSESSSKESEEEAEESVGTASTSTAQEEEVQRKEVRVKDAKKIVEKGEKSKDVSKSPVIPATRPTTPVKEKIMRSRKSSVGSDLIDFAPLIPTPPSSAEVKKQTVSPSAPIKRTSKPQDTPKKSESSPTKTSSTKVFVPAGESAEEHIAQFKKRERVPRGKTARTPSSTEASKPKVEVTSPKTPELKPQGLLASRWANKDDRDEQDAGEKKAHKLTTKSGCRPRRPASSSPASKPPAASAEKK